MCIAHHRNRLYTIASCSSTLISVILGLSQTHQLTPVWASASRGVPVWLPLFAGAHCAHLWRDDQADITWVAVLRRDGSPGLKRLTHSGTSHCRHGVAQLVDQNQGVTTKPNRQLTIAVCCKIPRY